MTDAEFEAMLREALAAETEIIQPSPDALETIRYRAWADRRPWYMYAAELAVSLLIAAAIIAFIIWGSVQILEMILHGYVR
jgi:negative regulator of sigma E activity